MENKLKCNIEDKLRCTSEGHMCNTCKRNPKAELPDHFHDRGYIPTCKYGYDDCVLDPAYLKDENSNCDGCIAGDWYDDEDK